MGSDFTGGGFEELERESAKLKADAARLRQVTQTTAANIETDEAARRRLAERARAATSRSIAEAETIVQRAASTGRVTGQASASSIANQRAQMAGLARESERALRPIEAMQRAARQYGPFAGRNVAAAGAFGPEATAATAANIARMRAVGQYAQPPAASGLAAPGSAMRGLSEQTGQRIPTQQQLNQYSAGVSRAATSHAVLNAQMLRHGALSSEFIQAMARGQVSLREFGNQLLITAGKFGGWLAAGAGIFALIGTISAVGGGAFDAATGVNQLRRVINDVDSSEAQAGFRRLAEEMNLPIDQVADAQYQMGKVFNDQTDSLEAARIVLAAVKVGELDVATASRYLTSITQGFNLEASEMTDVFGQINVAQNDFGVNIQDTLAGMGSAAGAAKTLGGTTPTVLAFFAAARRAAGVSGNVTGTAVQRMTTFLRANREELRQFGIDVDNMDLDEILQRAFKIAPTLDRQDQVKLSQGLFGTFYGPRVGLPALTGGAETFFQAQQKFEQAGESDWQAELNTTLENASEQITKIATQLGILGSNLAQSGFLDLLLVGVGALGLMLNAANAILGVFNLMPEQLTHSLTILAQMYLLFRLMRRFNVGSTLPGAAGRALTNPRNAINDQRERLGVRQTELSNELVNQSAAVTRAELERTAAREQANALARQERRLIESGTNDVRAQAAAAERTASARESLAGYDDRVNQARVRESVIAREIERNARETQATRGPQPIRGVYGIPVTPSGERTPGSRVRPTDGVYGIPYQRDSGTMVRNMQQQGVLAGVMATAAQQIRSAAGRVSARVRGVDYNAAVARGREAAKGIRESGQGMLSMISPLDVAIAGIGTFFFALSELRGRANEVQGIMEDLRGAESTGDIESAAKAARDQAANPPTFYIPGVYEGVLEDQREALNAADQALAETANFRNAIQRIGQRRPLAPEEEAALADGAYTDVFNEEATKIKKALDAGDRSGAAARRQFNALKRAARRSPNVEDPETLIDQMEQEIFGQRAAEASERVRKLAELDAARGPLYRPVGEARAALQTARRVEDAVRHEGGDRDQILDAQIGIENAERAYQEALNDRARSLLQARGAVALSRIDPENEIARARQTLQNARRQIEQMRRQKRPQEEIRQQIATINDAEFALQAAVRQRALDLIDTAVQMREANAPLYAPLVSERAALWGARQRLAVLRSTGGSAQEIRAQLAAIAGAERQLALAANDRAREVLEVTGEVAVAQIDPERTVAIARQTLTNAQDVLALLEAQGRDPVEIQRAYLTVLQTEQQLRDAIEARAEAIQQGLFDVAAARAERSGNDVRAAAVTARDALYDLQHADTREERLTARAALIRARTGQRDAIYQTEIEDIEYQADIGRLTIQQQIAGYQRLLRTLELNRDMRRDLRQRIYSLRQEAEEATGEFDLRLGNIRLPTAYEIRRALESGGVDTRSRTNVTINQTNNLEAHGGDSDEVVRKVNRQQERASRRAKSMLRSAGIN